MLDKALAPVVETDRQGLVSGLLARKVDEAGNGIIG